MKQFLNTTHGLLFVFAILTCAAAMEQNMFEGFEQQVGDKAAEFFKQELGQMPEQEDKEKGNEQDALQKSI